MAQQPTATQVTESVLLQPQPKASSSSFDQQPIGGGSKFTFSQYPSENDQPTAKPPARKNTKKKQQTKTTVQLPSTQLEEAPIKMTQPLDQIPVGGNNAPNTFDEKPIGKSENTFMMSEFPQGQPEEAPQTNYTMSQKLKSKAPKMRLSGLEDLLQLITNDPQSPEFEEISLPSLLKETTPANLQKILQCLKAWMEANKVWGEDEAKNAIENGYINGKPNTKKLTMQIVDLMYQTKVEMIEMVILIGFKSKTPKIIAGYNSVLNQLLAIYGIKRMKYLKAYLPEVIRVIGAEKLAAVKAEGMNTLREAYKWMGKETVQPMLSSLKQALKKQLDTQWEAYDKTIVMSAPKDLPQEGDGKTKGKKLDAYELSEAVDVFKKYSQKWSESVLKAEKWNQKTKMMEEFVKAASVPKLANTQNRHISQLIRRLINDSNFNVVLWTLKMVSVMAKGLRKHFSATAKAQFLSIIYKFRQKRTQMIDQTFATLNDLNHCLAIQDVLEDVKEGLVDKAPTMKVNLMNWIGKHVEQKSQEKGGECPEKTRDAVKKLFSLFEKLLEDGAAQVRETMVRNMGKLQLFLGQDFFNSIKGKAKSKIGSKIVDEKPQSTDKNIKKPQSQLSKSVITPKAVQKPGDSKILMGKTISGDKEKQVKVQQSPLQCFDQPSFEESLQTLVGLGLPEDQTKNVTAAGSAERSIILNYLRENPYENFNAVVRVIRRAFKQWKQVNLKMNKDLISYLQERVLDIGKPQSYVLIPFIAQKIGEAKFSQQLLKLVSSICERVPAKYIISHFIRYAKSPQNKKPKLNGDICSILIKIIQTVSLSNCNLKELVEYTKETFAVNFSKKGAQELLICLYSHAGESLKPMLDQTIVKSMDTDFKAIKPLSQDQKKPKIEFQGQAAAQSQIMSKKQSNKPDGKPRDLSLQVQKALPLMNDNGNWQKRKQGAQILSSQLQFGGKVTFGNSSGDLLTTLKAHINDSNKQLVKIFVHLAGLVLIALPQKELKVHFRSFIIALVGGLSDKTQQNKNEIITTLGRIGQTLGKQHLLSSLGSFLQGDKQGRLEVLHLILTHQEGINRADIKDYPKGLVNCLCDKNKDIRTTAERVLQKVHEKLGLDVFRNIAKDQRPAVAKDLTTLFDKFDRNSLAPSSFPSKGVSPSKVSEREPKPKTMTQPPPPPSSAKKRSLSRNNAVAKSFVQYDQDPHAMTSGGQFFVPRQNKVQGNELFAGPKILINQRVERLTNEELYVWRLDQIRESQQEAIRSDIQGLIREDIAKKLFSLDYRRVLDGTTQLIKASKDINQQPQLKQLFDVLLKWVLMKLWGGQPTLTPIVELVFPILSILEKKKAALTDFQVDLVLAIIRQYFISASLVGPKVSESLYAIIKCLIPLSSGQRVLKKILRQFFIDLPALHRHLRKEVNAFYRQGLCRMIKKELADHVGNEDTLEEASKIKELKEDPQFINMLFRRFHEDVLRCFGFKKLEGSHHTPSRSPPPIHNNESALSAKPPHPVNNGSFVNHTENRDRSGDRLPPVGHQNTMSQDLRPSQLPGKPLDRKTNLSQQQIVHQPTQPPTFPTSPSYQMKNTWNDPYESKTLDLSVYPAPHPASPLSKHLNKLLPPNESIINFFNTLFQQSGQKIANQLSSNAKIIFGSILKSVQDLIAARKDYTPERIVAQVTLLQSCIKCPHVVHNIGELLGYGTEFALTQLVYQDQHKTEIYQQLRARSIQYRADNFIKAINGVMLRLLQNGNPQDIVNVLLQLLTYHSRSIPNSAKTISLVVKCIGRVSKDFGKELRPQAVKLFLLRSHQFFSSISYDTLLEHLDLQQRQRNKQKIRPQDSAANSIKSVLIEVCKAIGSEIWEHYQKAMVDSLAPDQWISSFITSLNIKQPQRGRGRSQQNKQNEELKKINQLLSKNKSYQAGIAQLKKYTQKHPQFSAEQYFTSLNYDRRFIQMVVGSLDGQRRSAIRADSREQDGGPENIQERIRRLKERFQELQPQGEGSGNNSMNRGRAGQEEEQREERALQIRRRIQEMKNKMNSAVRNR